MSTSSTPESPSQYDDHRRPIIRGIKAAVIGLAVIAIASLAIWGGMHGLPGIWGVLLGVAVGGGYVLLTAVSVLATANTSAGMTGTVVLGGWLVKLVIVLLLFIWLEGMTFYHQGSFIITLLISLVVAIAAEVWGVVTTNVTYTS